MNFIIHRIIMTFVFLTGFICFFCYSINQDFFLATILLSLSALFVNLYGFLTNTLSQKNFIYLFSLFSFFISVSVFANYGVEQKPIGYQTLYSFNLEGIAVSLILCLLSSLLVAIGSNQNTAISAIPKMKIKTPKKRKIQPKNIVQSDDWQEASLEDIKSGKYQIL